MISQFGGICIVTVLFFFSIFFIYFVIFLKTGHLVQHSRDCKQLLWFERAHLPFCQSVSDLVWDLLLPWLASVHCRFSFPPALPFVQGGNRFVRRFFLMFFHSLFQYFLQVVPLRVSLCTIVSQQYSFVICYLLLVSLVVGSSVILFRQSQTASLSLGLRLWCSQCFRPIPEVVLAQQVFLPHPQEQRVFSLSSLSCSRFSSVSQG